MKHRVWPAALAVLLAAGGATLAGCTSTQGGPTPEDPITAAGDTQLPDGIAKSHPLRDGETVVGTTAGSIVVAATPTAGTASVRVLDADNPRTIWSSEERFAGAAVKVIGLDADVVIVELRLPSSEALVAGLTAESGSILWTLPTQGNRFQPIRGTGTGLLRTDSVPIVISTTSGTEMWRGEPGDTMRATLGATVVTDQAGGRAHFDLTDGRSINARSGLKGKTSKWATAAGTGFWTAGHGVLAANGAVQWGDPTKPAGHTVGDDNHVAILTKTRSGWTAQLHRTTSGEDGGVTEVATCQNAEPLGFTRGVLVWQCPRSDRQEFMRARLQ